jgi:hypothetical protein
VLESASVWQRVEAFILAGASPEAAGLACGIPLARLRRVLYPQPGHRLSALERAVHTQLLKAQASAQVAAATRLLREEPARWLRLNPVLSAAPASLAGGDAEWDHANSLLEWLGCLGACLGQFPELRPALAQAILRLPELPDLGPAANRTLRSWLGSLGLALPAGPARPDPLLTQEEPHA